MLKGKKFDAFALVQGGRREGQKVKKKAFFFVVCLNSCNFAPDFKNRQKKNGIFID